MVSELSHFTPQRQAYGFRPYRSLNGNTQAQHTWRCRRSQNLRGWTDQVWIGLHRDRSTVAPQDQSRVPEPLSVWASAANTYNCLYSPPDQCSHSGIVQDLVAEVLGLTWLLLRRTLWLPR